MQSRHRVMAQAVLKVTGKTRGKVIAVFGLTPEACHQAVLYVRRHVPDIPVWLFSRSQPSEETRRLCERVTIRRDAAALLIEAEHCLWPRRVALSVGTWTGEPGGWPLKLAPLLIPPFRCLFMNEHGGFLSGGRAAAIHIRRRSRERVQAKARTVQAKGHAAKDAALSAYHRAQDLLRAYWLLISYHIWRSGPCRRMQDLGRAYWRLVSYHIWRSGPCRRVWDVVRAESLMVAATALQWSGYPNRRWFGRLHGQRTLRIEEAPRRGVGLVCFHQDGPNWRGNEFEAAARQSDARWMVWYDRDTAEPIDDLLPLFDDPRTFAVSRQTHYRGWRPSLVPMAAFRVLQPGEASQVLAPISSTIVVDRQRLLALGIPRCDLTVAAWLLVFWKAAAAGWRSYSVGDAGMARQQPDHPAQETAFFLQTLARREMRQLGPSEPDLARGTIAFCPAIPPVRAADPEALRVLIVSPFVPYPLSHGGAVRIYNLCRALRDRVDFTLAAVRERDDVVDYDKLHDVFGEVKVVDLDERPLPGKDLPLQVRQHRSSSLKALIRDLVKTHRPDLMQIEFTHMALFREAAREVPAVLVEHDLTFNLYEQLADRERGRRAYRHYQRWLAFERRQFRVFDGIWTVRDDDRRRAIREGGADDRTFTIPNGVDLERFAPAPALAAVPEVLYVGSFRHLPNILGFEALRREIMPRVWDHCPEARLRVVAGPQPEMFWQKLRGSAWPADLDSRITIHGFVEDLRPLYAKAWAVAVPLEVSSGTNIKVLEAMACGKAIVTTPVGCSGLDLRTGHDFLIAADPQAFAGALCAVLSNDNLRLRLESQARRAVEARFSWTSIADAAYESYSALAGPRSSSRTPAGRPDKVTTAW